MSPRAAKSAASSAVAPELPALPAPPPERTATDERREQQLEDILQAIGGDGRIAVYNDGKYAGVMPIEGFSLESLFDAYGGGDKSLVIYQGQRKVETVRVQLDPDVPATSPRQRKLEEARARSGGTGGGGGGGSSADMSAMLTTFMTAQLQSMQASQQMMTGMVSAITALMTARPEKDPMEVALQMARLMKEGQASGGGVGTAEVLGLLEKGIGMGKLLSGGSEDDGTLGVVREGLGIVGKIVDAQASQASSRGGGGGAGAAAYDGRRYLGAGGAEQNPAHGAAGAGTDGRTRGGGAVAAVGHDDSSGGAPATENSGNGRAAGAGPVSQGTRPWVRAVGGHFNTLAAVAGWMTPATAAHAISDRLDDEAFADLLDDIQDTTPPGFGGRLKVVYPVAASVAPEWLEEVVTLLLTDFSQDESGSSGAAYDAGDDASEGGEDAAGSTLLPPGETGEA